MKVGILGSGAVGQAMAKGFLSEGHEVWLATRTPDSEKGAQLKSDIPDATIADFATAAREAELAILCVKWEGANDAIRAAGAENLAGKVVMDTSNLIKQEAGVLVYAGDSAKSGAEQVQDWLANSRVVKAFNTVGAATMYKPDFGGQVPTMFLAGDDAEAKQQVSVSIRLFGWEPLDVGKLIAARNLEPMALLWINNSIASGTPQHAFKML